MQRTSNRNLWIGLGILAVVALLALPMLGFGMWGRGVGGPDFGFRPYGFGGPFFWGFWGIGLLIKLAFWGGLIFLFLNIFRRRTYWTHHDEPSSLEILRQRYAAGEITREQYDEMRRVLEASPTTSSA